MKRISHLTKAEKSALALELRQKRLQLHQRQVERRKQIKQLVNDLEKDDQRLQDIETSLDNLEQL